MKKKSFIFYIIIGLIVCLIGIFFLTKKFKPKEKVEEEKIVWTKQNALYQVESPNLVDQRNQESLITAIHYSLEYYEKCSSNQVFTLGSHDYSLEQVRQSLVSFRDKLREYGLSDDFFSYVRESFLFYQSAIEEVLVTGYYEARLQGALTRTDIYKYPLYRAPEDMVYINLSEFPLYSKYEGLPKALKGRYSGKNRILPYYSREEIDVHQELANQKRELVWIDNPIDVFFLQIQGSGMVELRNGEMIRVNYAGSNGHPYRAIGTLLIQQEILTRENVSMQSIREYLENNPDKLDEVFNYNPSYVFFKKVEKGPLGFMGVPVTPYRSIATDRHLFPKGVLCYIETELPIFDSTGIDIERWEPYKGFVLNQDTGGAIRSPGRMDLFTGHGDMNELIAGHMKQPGKLYFLINKNF